MRLKPAVWPWFSGVLLYWCLIKLLPSTLGTYSLTYSFVPCNETSFSHQDSLLFLFYSVYTNLFLICAAAQTFRISTFIFHLLFSCT